MYFFRVANARPFFAGVWCFVRPVKAESSKTRFWPAGLLDTSAERRSGNSLALGEDGMSVRLEFDL